MMNLKKFFCRSIFLSFVIFSLAFTGCQHSADATVSLSGGSREESRSLRAGIENYNSTITYTEDGVRSILPEQWKVDDENVKFYIYGKSSNGREFGPTRVTPDGSGYFNLPLEPYSWVLTLFACVGDYVPVSYNSAFTSAALYAVAVADMTKYASAVYFKLSSVGLTGTGYINLKLLLDGWDMTDISPSLEADISLTNPASGNVISYTTGTTTKKTGVSSGELSSTRAYSFGVGDLYSTKLNPGYYNLTVSFINRSTGIDHVWSDLVYVESGTTTKAEIKIPCILDRVPDAPSDFKVCYDSASVDKISGFYDAYFYWTDNSTNEKTFQIELYDQEPDSTPQRIYYDSSVIGDGEVYSQGSLSANAKEVVLRLPMEKIWTARIRAVNSSGYSDWCDCQIADSLPVPAKVNVTPSLFKNMLGDKANVINLHRVLYNMTGGTWYKDWDGSAGTQPSLSTIVEYYGVVSGFPVSVRFKGYSELGLSKNSKRLVCWYMDGIVAMEKKRIPSEEYLDSCRNISLYASYDDTSFMTMEKLAAMTPENIWIDINSTRLTNGVNTYPVGLGFTLGVTVPKSVGDALVNPSFKFDSIKVSVKSIATGSVRNFEYSGDDIAGLGSRTVFNCGVKSAGEYEMTITFEYSGYRKFLGPITLNAS